MANSSNNNSKTRTGDYLSFTSGVPSFKRGNPNSRTTGINVQGTEIDASTTRQTSPRSSSIVSGRAPVLMGGTSMGPWNIPGQIRAGEETEGSTTGGTIVIQEVLINGESTTTQVCLYELDTVSVVLSGTLDLAGLAPSSFLVTLSFNATSLVVPVKSIDASKKTLHLYPFFFEEFYVTGATSTQIDISVLRGGASDELANFAGMPTRTVESSFIAKFSLGLYVAPVAERPDRVRVVGCLGTEFMWELVGSTYVAYTKDLASDGPYVTTGETLIPPNNWPAASATFKHDAFTPLVIITEPFDFTSDTHRTPLVYDNSNGVNENAGAIPNEYFMHGLDDGTDVSPLIRKPIQVIRPTYPSVGFASYNRHNGRGHEVECGGDSYYQNEVGTISTDSAMVSGVPSGPFPSISMQVIFNKVDYLLIVKVDGSIISAPYWMGNLTPNNSNIDYSLDQWHHYILQEAMVNNGRFQRNYLYNNYNSASDRFSMGRLTAAATGVSPQMSVIGEIGPGTNRLPSVHKLSFEVVPFAKAYPENTSDTNFKAPGTSIGGTGYDIDIGVIQIYHPTIGTLNAVNLDTGDPIGNLNLVGTDNLNLTKVEALVIEHVGFIVP